tara:strand:- start:892 stop:1437 length:546 start_codon:yes stop_codon:yes gene_type:complete
MADDATLVSAEGLHQSLLEVMWAEHCSPELHTLVLETDPDKMTEPQLGRVLQALQLAKENNVVSVFYPLDDLTKSMAKAVAGAAMTKGVDLGCIVRLTVSETIPELALVLRENKGVLDRTGLRAAFSRILLVALVQCRDVLEPMYKNNEDKKWVNARLKKLFGGVYTTLVAKAAVAKMARR